MFLLLARWHCQSPLSLSLSLPCVHLGTCLLQIKIWPRVLVDDGLRLELRNPVRTGIQYLARQPMLPCAGTHPPLRTRSTLTVTVPEPGVHSSSATAMRLAGTYSLMAGLYVLGSTTESSVLVCGFNYGKALASCRCVSGRNTSRYTHAISIRTTTRRVSC